MPGQYYYLFIPIRIGQTNVANRIVFAAHLTNLAEENLPGPRLIAYYAERARGGCGLIITEEQSVHPSDWTYQKLIHGFDTHVIPAYRRMTRAVQEHGTRIFAQINHNGMQASSIYSRRPVLGPSPLPDPIHREMCKEIEPEEIAEIVRGQICDPAFTRKAREGRTESIRLCISCNQYCIGRMGLNLSLGCIQTPATGNELLFPEIHRTNDLKAQSRRTTRSFAEFTLSAKNVLRMTKSSRMTPSGQGRRPTVLIVGGGVAGMQAAKVAAERGFRVKLYERQRELGGQVNLLVRVPNRVEFGDVSRNLQHEILRFAQDDKKVGQNARRAGQNDRKTRRNDSEAGIEVQLGVEVTAEMVEREQPDAVIIATGSLPLLPPIPGSELPHVATVWQVILGEKTAQPGEYVMVYDQLGFHQATGTAELLAEKGCKVEFVTPQFFVGGDLSVTLDIELWYRRALAKGMQMTADHFLASFGPNSATIINNYTGQPRQLENVALAVLVTPQAANDRLYLQLQGKVKQLYRIGDCLAPRRVENAILDGERTARALNMP